MGDLERFVALAKRVRDYRTSARVYKSEWDPRGKPAEPRLDLILNEIEDALREYEESKRK